MRLQIAGSRVRTTVGSAFFPPCSVFFYNIPELNEEACSWWTTMPSELIEKGVEKHVGNLSLPTLTRNGNVTRIWKNILESGTLYKTVRLIPNNATSLTSFQHHPLYALAHKRWPQLQKLLVSISGRLTRKCIQLHPRFFFFLKIDILY